MIIDQDLPCWTRGRGYRRTGGGAGQRSRLLWGLGGWWVGTLVCCVPTVNVSFIILLTVGCTLVLHLARLASREKVMLLDETSTFFGLICVWHLC